MATILKCPICGKEFKPFKNSQKYCSIDCRKKNHAKTHFNIIKTYNCNWCGISFESQHKRKYCSNDCRLRANGKRFGKKGITKNILTLDEVAVLSREAGMSYGEYVQKMGL